MSKPGEKYRNLGIFDLLGTLDATSKVPFPPWQTEARQHKCNKDAASDVHLGCGWHSERVSERAFEKPLKPLKCLKTSKTLSNPLKISKTL